MKRLVVWLVVGLVIYVAGTIAYLPELDVSAGPKFVATMAFRGYVYVTLIAVAIAVARWLIGSRRPA